MITDRQHGRVVWLIGLPSSGKRTWPRPFIERLLGKRQPVEIHDGGEVRDTNSAELGFFPEDRSEPKLG